MREKTFDIIKNLDEKCYLYDNNLILTSVNQIFLCVVSVVFDTMGLWYMNLPASTIHTLVTAFAAHNTECVFYSLLISIINEKMKYLSNVNPRAGSRIYRHILLAASHFNEEFKFRISMMFFVTMITSLIYAGVIFLSDAFSAFELVTFLLWREIKSLHSTWLLCYVAYQSDRIANELLLKLAIRVTNNVVTKDPLHEVTRRWYKGVRALRPRYGDGSMNLSVPFVILDLTCNYLLIIMQMYAEFVSKRT